MTDFSEGFENAVLYCRDVVENSENKEEAAKQLAELEAACRKQRLAKTIEFANTHLKH